MGRRLRFFISLMCVMLILFTFQTLVISPSFARGLSAKISFHQHFVLASSNLYNNVALPAPSWWNGSCDVNNNPGSILLGSSYRGMPTCGPFPAVHPDHVVYFPKGSQVQVNEWECTELAMRYLYLAYGQHPYVADGGSVVSNYPGNLLKPISNKAIPGNAPQVGDVISSNTSDPHGHVVVVQAEDPTVQTTGTGNITVVDENGITGSGGIETYHDTKWLVDSGVIGWLHPNTLVTSANPNTYNSLLYAVDAMGAHDAKTTDLSNVWAVGDTAVNNVFQTLIERWDGAHWSVIPNTPNLGIGDDLYSVAVLSPTNIWAVGRYYDTNNVRQTLFLHYNGKSWIASTHGPGQLYAITRVSGSEAWAVGTSNTGSQTELTYHLVGSTWTPVADTSVNVILTAVSASSATNVWAVGYSTGGVSLNTVTLHWTGGPSWTVVPSPNPGSSDNELWGVTAINANTAWAVGRSDSTPNSDGFVMKWTSQSGWGQPYNLPITSGNILLSVAALSPTNIWAVGRIGLSTLVEHYNGSGWRQIPSVDIGYDLFGSVMVNRANGNVWAVGQYQTYGVQAQTLTEFFN